MQPHTADCQPLLIEVLLVCQCVFAAAAAACRRLLYCVLQHCPSDGCEQDWLYNVHRSFVCILLHHCFYCRRVGLLLPAQVIRRHCSGPFKPLQQGTRTAQSAKQHVHRRQEDANSDCCCLRVFQSRGSVFTRKEFHKLAGCALVPHRTTRAGWWWGCTSHVCRRELLASCSTSAGLPCC
jgi:hypothetical protein